MKKSILLIIVIVVAIVLTGWFMHTYFQNKAKNVGSIGTIPKIPSPSTPL